MTDFHVEVIRVGAIEKHPNADTLGITKVGDYTVIARLGEYSPGDLAVYVPVDSVVPATDPRWAFLGGRFCIKAKRLRGVFSEGLLTPAEPGMSEGDDVAEQLGIKRYESSAESNERQWKAHGNGIFSTPVNPPFLPKYTDLENLKRWPNILAPGEPVIITEKIEGENVRYAYARPTRWERFVGWLARKPARGSLIVGSRNQIKTDGKWCEVAERSHLAEMFSRQVDPERYSLYGESYGYTKGFRYGTDGLGAFRLFDVWDRIEERWLDWDEVQVVAQSFDLPKAPLLYEGPWSPELAAVLSEGPSVLDDSHVREGFVVRPVVERRHPRLGRVILKCKGQGYLLRKEAA